MAMITAAKRAAILKHSRAAIVRTNGDGIPPSRSPHKICSAFSITHVTQNLEISGNQCFDDQLTKTQTWGIILAGVSVHPDPRFPVKATEHVRIRENDLRGNLHSEACWMKAVPMTSSSHPTLPDDRTRAAIGRCVTHSSQ